MCVEPRPSPIHGTGLFATEPIPAETHIGDYEGPATDVNGTYVLWLEDDDGHWHGIDGSNVLRWLNHSDEPNARFWGAELWSVRDIEPDEEITFDYGPEWSAADVAEPVEEAEPAEENAGG